MLTSLFSLFYVTSEFHRFLRRGRATKIHFPPICKLSLMVETESYYCSKLGYISLCWLFILYMSKLTCRMLVAAPISKPTVTSQKILTNNHTGSGHFRRRTRVSKRKRRQPFYIAADKVEIRSRTQASHRSNTQNCVFFFN